MECTLVHKLGLLRNIERQISDACQTFFWKFWCLLRLVRDSDYQIEEFRVTSFKEECLSVSIEMWFFSCIFQTSIIGCHCLNFPGESKSIRIDSFLWLQS